MQNEAAQLDAEAALQRQRLVLANEAFARLESLRNDQFISSAQVQAKSEELLGLRAQAQALERQRAALAREQAELEGERRGLPLLARGALGGIERDLAALSREAAEQDAERADRGARAAGRHRHRAGWPSPGRACRRRRRWPAWCLRARGCRRTCTRRPVRWASCAPTQTVRLRYEAFPYQQFGHHPGQVLQVSRTPLAPSELQALSLPVAPAEGEALFRITVALDLRPPRRPRHCRWCPACGCRPTCCSSAGA